jgi:hypothetical protein
MRLPRMTTRRWMIVVAIVANGSGAWILRARSHTYAIESGYHSLMEAENRRFVGLYEAGSLGYTGRGSVDAFIDQARRLAAYHATLKRKYELASSRPWLPVEPDPPEPK